MYEDQVQIVFPNLEHEQPFPLHQTSNLQDQIKFRLQHHQFPLPLHDEESRVANRNFLLKCLLDAFVDKFRGRKFLGKPEKFRFQNYKVFSCRQLTLERHLHLLVEFHQHRYELYRELNKLFSLYRRYNQLLNQDVHQKQLQVVYDQF